MMLRFKENGFETTNAGHTNAGHLVNKAMEEAAMEEATVVVENAMLTPKHLEERVRNAEKIEAGLVKQGRDADEKESENVFLGENLARGFKLMTKVAALAAAQES